jgi:exoribonuclease II
LYGDYSSPKSVKVASRVIKNNPDLPPAFDDERDIDMFDELVYDATEFTYNYMKNHKLYCEEMNDWIENTGTDWQPLKKSK